jgi:hypothetical protein
LQPVSFCSGLYREMTSFNGEAVGWVPRPAIPVFVVDIRLFSTSLMTLGSCILS